MGVEMSVVAPQQPRVPVETVIREMPRCTDCAHWTPVLPGVTGPARGPCAISLKRGAGMSVFAPDTRPAQVWTAEDFGCVKFERRR